MLLLRTHRRARQAARSTAATAPSPARTRRARSRSAARLSSAARCRASRRSRLASCKASSYSCSARVAARASLARAALSSMSAADSDHDDRISPPQREKCSEVRVKHLTGCPCSPYSLASLATAARLPPPGSSSSRLKVPVLVSNPLTMASWPSNSTITPGAPPCQRLMWAREEVGGGISGRPEGWVPLDNSLLAETLCSLLSWKLYLRVSPHTPIPIRLVPICCLA
mmetsp:Transcript_19176/g.45745  ORF Transcript_19176/g.45745 Transcript_19176/m.45745 type:complete len:227 (+) Transcript_19176:170-850(+)